MLSQTYRTLKLEPVLERLARLREEWQEAAPETSLLDIDAPVALLLNDVLAALGLPEGDIERVLGEELAAQLRQTAEDKLPAAP